MFNEVIFNLFLIFFLAPHFSYSANSFEISLFRSLLTCSRFSYRFLFPALLIVINDIAAYFTGFFFGRTPLIKLSPKKTWEGFIGASITTMFSAFLVSHFSDHLVFIAIFTISVRTKKRVSIPLCSCDFPKRYLFYPVITDQYCNFFYKIKVLSNNLNVPQLNKNGC